MRAHWTEIEAWLKSNAPAVYEGLNPPATAQQVAETEKALGMSFPAHCVASFRIHNGQRPDSPWLFDAWELLSLERIVEDWKAWKDLLDAGEFSESRSVSYGATVEDWWSPLWIPLTYDGAGNHDCLDLSPGSDGRSGQIIKMWHDDVVAWLESGDEVLADTLQSENGEISYCGIDLDLIDADKAVPFICDFLALCGAPKGSKLIFEIDGVEQEVPFGKLEGLAIYLNGTVLLPEVYENCDINHVYDEINRLLGDRGEIQGHWQGPTETALYLYGYGLRSDYR